MGINNHVASIRAGKRSIAEALEALAGPTTVLPSGRLARVGVFWALCHKLKPDAVIAHFFTIDHVFLAIAARLAGVRRVVAVQGNPAPSQKQRTLVRKVATILNASRLLGIPIISASHWIENSLTALGSLPYGSRVIHNGSDVAAIAAAAKFARSERCDDDAVILMIARLDPIKDHKTLLAAVANIPEVNGRRVRLDLVGDGVLRDDLEAETAVLGISDRVRFLGTRSDATALIGTADLFCLSTTRDEGFGIVLVEALAAGIPIVASDVPACREVLKDGLFGVLVPAGEADTLAFELRKSLTDTPSACPKNEIEEHYGVKEMANSYLGVMLE